MSQKYVVYTFSLFLVTFSTIKRLTNVFSSYHLSDIDMKTFKIGNDRSLKLDKKNDSISIEDKGTKKATHFTLPDGHRSYCVSTKSTTSYADCLKARTWHTACIMACMAHIADQRLSLRRSVKILRTQGPEHVEAYKDRHRSASPRMANIQAGCREFTS